MSPFYQRLSPCSLVYSFQGEDVSNSSESELFRLSEMAGIEVQQPIPKCRDLKRRGLVQQRGVGGPFYLTR